MYVNSLLVLSYRKYSIMSHHAEKILLSVLCVILWCVIITSFDSYATNTRISLRVVLWPTIVESWTTWMTASGETLSDNAIIQSVISGVLASVEQSDTSNSTWYSSGSQPFRFNTYVPLFSTTNIFLSLLSPYRSIWQ